MPDRQAAAIFQAETFGRQAGHAADRLVTESGRIAAY